MDHPKSAFQTPIQIGMVVRDLDTTLKNLEEIFGIGPVRIVEFPPRDETDIKMVYHGRDTAFSAKFCFYNWSNIELELIQPLSGPSVWQDFLDEKGPGLHHIKFSVPEHEPVREYLAQQGIPIAQIGSSVGKNKGKEWVYYDTEDKIGFSIELMNEIVR